MQVEPYENKSGYRIWLNEIEEEQLLSYYENEPLQELNAELALCGLRIDEVLRVKFEDFRKLETEETGYMLHVWESKTDYRETPVPASVYEKAEMIRNIKNLRKDEPYFDVTKKTLQRWIENAAEAQADGAKHWEHVSPHDLRRTWATRTYWSLTGDRAREIVMSWGGWSDVQTFKSNYLGKVPDSVAIEAMEEADLL